MIRPYHHSTLRPYYHSIIRRFDQYNSTIRRYHQSSIRRSNVSTTPPCDYSRPFEDSTIRRFNPINRHSSIRRYHYSTVRRLDDSIIKTIQLFDHSTIQPFTSTRPLDDLTASPFNDSSIPPFHDSIFWRFDHNTVPLYHLYFIWFSGISDSDNTSLLWLGLGGVYCMPGTAPCSAGDIPSSLPLIRALPECSWGLSPCPIAAPHFSSCNYFLNDLKNCLLRHHK